MNKTIKDDAFWLLVLYLAMVVLVFFLNLPLPQDDLLRDIVAGDYRYNYANLYIHAPLMAKYNQYILFDIILHWLNVVGSRIITAHLIQFICMVGFVMPVLMIVLKVLNAHKHKYVLATLLMMLLLNNFSMLRLILARPEMIFTCWVLWGLAFKSRMQLKVLWFAFGLLLIPCYWLSFFYIPAVFVIFNRPKAKMLLSVSYLVISVCFWQSYSHGAWFSSVLDLPVLNHNRLATIGENKTILIMLLSPVTSIAAIIYLFLHNEQLKDVIRFIHNLKVSIFSNIKLIPIIRSLSAMLTNNSLLTTTSVLFGYFIIFNMIRYAAILSALFVIIITHSITKVSFRMPTIHKYIVLCLCIYLPLGVENYKFIPKFVLPQNSIVLGTSQSNYYVPFYSPNLKIAPAMEIGANEQGVQQIMKSIEVEGSVSCTELKKYHFEFLVERSLTTISPCLQIYQLQKGWRAWKVIY